MNVNEQDALHICKTHQLEIQFRKMDGAIFTPHVVVRGGFHWHRGRTLVDAVQKWFQDYHGREWDKNDHCWCEQYYVPEDLLGVESWSAE